MRRTATIRHCSPALIVHSTDACWCLNLAPTGELAQQSRKVVLALGDYLEVRCHAGVDGIVVTEDIAKLTQGVFVGVGTPGCVRDMVEKGHLRVDYQKLGLLDAAGEMFHRASRRKFTTFSGNSLMTYRSFCSALLCHRTP